MNNTDNKNDFYETIPVNAPLNCKVTVPGSKSITNRALILAAMAEGRGVLSNVLFSGDSRAVMDCLAKLGYDITVNEAEKTVTILGCPYGLPCEKAEINVRSAGTAARFVTALLAGMHGEFSVDASSQMKKRPMRPLCDALIGMGAKIVYLKNEGFLPFKVFGGGLSGGEVILESEKSSQFLSALLMTGCLCERDLKIIPAGKEISKTYVDITLKMMEQWGVKAELCGDGAYLVRAGQKYKAREYKIEPDVSGACYFYAAACLTGGIVLVKDVFYSSMQGDIRFLDILKEMGCEVTETNEGIALKGPKDGKFSGIDIDMNDCSDQTMTLAAIAPYAATPTTIRNVGHIRYQESDRISAILTELRKMDIKCEEITDGIVIYPGVPKPTLVETYDDHRMAMAFALMGFRTTGVKIKNPSCVSKTFENYFEVLKTL